MGLAPSGEQLVTIALQYCTCLGLIKVGILPQPPLWDHVRMIEAYEANPKRKSIFVSHTGPLPTPKKIRTITDVPLTSFVKTIECDCYDLTQTNALKEND